MSGTIITISCMSNRVDFIPKMSHSSHSISKLFAVKPRIWQYGAEQNLRSSLILHQIDQLGSVGSNEPLINLDTVLFDIFLCMHVLIVFEIQIDVIGSTLIQILIFSTLIQIQYFDLDTNVMSVTVYMLIKWVKNEIGLRANADKQGGLSNSTLTDPT